VKPQEPAAADDSDWLPLGPPKAAPVEEEPVREEDDEASLAQFEPEPEPEPEPELTIAPAAPFIETVAGEPEFRPEPGERGIQRSVLFDAHNEREIPEESPLSRGVLPLVFALIVGLAVGFAGGYGVGSNAVPDGSGSSPKTSAASSTPPAPEREFTETAVNGGSAPENPANSATSGNSETRANQTDPVESATPANPVNAALGRIEIRSTPSGARVMVNGRDIGRTPMTAENVAPGTHTLRIVREGYRPLERRVTVTGDRPSPAVSVQLIPERPAPASIASAASARSERTPAREPAAPPASLSKTTGAVFIESRPIGASVLVDGKPSGTTPMLLEGLNAGDHVIQIDAQGYRRWTSAVRIMSGVRARVAASLER
jgi:hypothetical protein